MIFSLYEARYLMPLAVDGIVMTQDSLKVVIGYPTNLVVDGMDMALDFMEVAFIYLINMWN